MTVLGYAGSTKQGAAKWHCKCECGNEKTVVGTELRRNKTQSCGCLHSEIQTAMLMKHGMTNERLYNIWRTMLARCADKEDKNYGGRGISVCEQWRNNPVSFKEWAIKSGYNDELTIDRIDVNGDYCPNNCRWVTMKVQQNNRRNNHLLTYYGETHTLAEWEQITGIDHSVINGRLLKGWTIEEALTKPVRKQRRKQ